MMATPLNSNGERLLESIEDAADVSAYGEARRKLAAGDDELVASAMADRLLAGENPIRVWREHRGLTVKTLAEKAGVTQPYLSQVETVKREGRSAPRRRSR